MKKDSTVYDILYTRFLLIELKKREDILKQLANGKLELIGKKVLTDEEVDGCLVEAHKNTQEVLIMLYNSTTLVK